MTRHRLLSGLIALAASLAAAPAASADDASLFNAYNARQGQMDAAADEYLRAAKRAGRTGSRRAFRAVIRANGHMNQILATIKSDLVHQSASSEHGKRARAHAFREVRWWRRANTFENRGIRAILRGQPGRARYWLRRGTRTVRRCYREGRRAVRQFSAVGLTSPLGPISAK